MSDSAPGRTRWFRRVALAAAASPLLAGGLVRAQGPDRDGSIAGTVTVPNAGKPQSLRVTTDVEYCGRTLPSEAVLATAEGRLANAVVYLDLASPKPGQTPPGTVLVRNEQCRFVPHVQAALAGATVTLTNDDPLLHNVHFFLHVNGQRRTVANLALPGKVPRLDASRAARRPGLIEVRCDAHEWMTGWILLLDHQYFALTDKQGRFTIPDVPPGTYTMRVWHEALGELRQEVVVRVGQVARVSLRFGSS